MMMGWKDSQWDHTQETIKTVDSQVRFLVAAVTNMKTFETLEIGVLYLLLSANLNKIG